MVGSLLSVDATFQRHVWNAQQAFAPLRLDALSVHTPPAGLVVGTVSESCCSVPAETMETMGI